MGKARRKHGARVLKDFLEDSLSQELRNRQLAEEEGRLLSKQRYVSGLSDTCYEGSSPKPLTAEHLIKAFRQRFGDSSVVHAQISYRRRPRRRGSPSITYAGSDSQAPEVLGAVVEFNDAKTAQFVDKQLQFIEIDGGSWDKELVLRLDDVGGLKKAGVVDSHRYVRLSHRKGPNQPSQYQHPAGGGSGKLCLLASRLQVGSVGPDGTTLIIELDTKGTAGLTEVTVNYEKRQLCISTQMRGKHLLVNNFKDLRRRLSFDRTQRTLTFTITQPPRILEPFTGTCAGCSLSGAEWDLSGPMYQLAGDPTAPHRLGMKLPSFCPLCAPDEWLEERDYGWPLREQEPQIGSGLAGADGSLGRCFTYRLKLHPSAVKGLDANGNEHLRKLSSFRLISVGDYHRWQRSQWQQAARHSSRTVAVGVETDEQSSSADERVVSCSDWVAQHGHCRLNEVLEGVDCMVAYNVLVLLSSATATFWQVSTPEFAALLRQSSPDLACQALEELAVSRVPLVNATKALEQQLLELAAIKEAMPDSSDSVDSCKLFKVLRIHVTPTRVKFLPAEVQTGNRVIRHFCSPAAADRKYPDGLDCLDWLQFSNVNFLRVSFGDEHGDRLLGNREEVGTAYYKRMYYAISKGVVVNGQEFAFLAYSSSQLRTWSCWMVADPNQGTLISVGASKIADALRHWLGDALTSELVPARCAARLGQAFSTTVDATTMSEHEVVEIPDVDGPEPQCYAAYDPLHGLSVRYSTTYCFSDGVGRISSELLDEVLKELPFASIDLGPISAVQIRFQGYKGVLSRYSGLSGRQLQLRPSMNKFGSKHPQLEVVSVAAYRPAYLNRQVILMMNHNGVEFEVIISKLEVVLDQLCQMTSSVDAALDLLPALGAITPGAHDALIRLLHVSRACKVVMDPLMTSCLKAVAQWQVTDLRQKARLLVREGATLMGVLDEYGVLEGDEVFVQIQRPHRGRLTCGPPQIITGAITLAKHPVSHRGDTRLVTAVNPDSRPGGRQLINDYINVIVFAQHGQRPLPNKLAGADLDGDQFLVIWDEDLLQPYNSEPMDYGAKPPDKVSEIEVHHLQEHFVNYIKNDNLGQISTWLLAHADRDGADCDACERLAELHSIAVDFAKTGRPATLSPEESRRLMPSEFAYPHWLGNPHRESYHSETVLGEFYDRVTTHPINQKLEDDRISSGSNSSIGQHVGNNSSSIGKSSHSIEHNDVSRCSSSALHPSLASQLSRCDSHHTLANRCDSGCACGSRASVDATAANHDTELSGTANCRLWPEQLLHVPGILPGYSKYLRSAAENYKEFEDDAIQLMNHLDVCDVGEMLTCCVRWVQSLQHHQRWGQREHLFRELQAVFTAARRRYLQGLLMVIGATDHIEDLHGWTNKTLEAKADELFGSSKVPRHAAASHHSTPSGSSVRLQYAVAYMVIANKSLIRQQAQLKASGGETATCSSPSCLMDVDYGGSESDDDDVAGAGAGAGAGNAAEDQPDQSDGQHQQGVQIAHKFREVKALVRLAFQWVVAKELQELAGLL